MCFSPKIKTPKVQTPTTPIDPAPLTEEPKGVLFGGDADTVAESGRKTLKVEPAKATTKPAGTTGKSKIAKRIFN